MHERHAASCPTVDRTREILRTDPDPEKRALAQKVIDLTAAVTLLEACLDDARPGDEGVQTRGHLREHFFHEAAS